MAEIKVPVIFVIGGPGSGKGTQCDRIVAKYGFTHLSTGDLLREECNSGTERGAHLVDIMKKGQLVPNDAMLDEFCSHKKMYAFEMKNTFMTAMQKRMQDDVLTLLKEAIQKNLPNSNGFLIDGYPREAGQAIEFEKQICKCSLILFFDVTDDVMKARLLERGKTSGRPDDNEETIAKRLDTFHKHTQPILDHYGDKVKKIPATGTVDEIFAQVTAIMDSCKC